MNKKSGIIRFTVSTLFGFLVLIVGIWLVHKITLSSYTYSENLIESEAERISSKDVTKMSIHITNQTTLNDIATTLYKENFITSKNYFKMEAKMEHQTSGFIPGDYSLTSNMSTSEILTLLTTNPSNTEEVVKFTIPEGYTIDQMAELLDEKNIVVKSDFINAIKNRNYSSEYSFLSNIPPNDDYKYELEGYLFPDTYIVRKNVTAEEIIIMMLNRFDTIISKYSPYINSSNYSIHELIAIASIIEQEAKLDEERPIISGVIYNRLNAGMRLQMCSTVQYSLNNRKTNLTLEDLKQDKPYNTYLYNGLPIGPICSPGEACIKAALIPAEHDYYYFVLEDPITGTHIFNKTSEEHNISKSQYHQSNDVNFTE